MVVQIKHCLVVKVVDLCDPQLIGVVNWEAQRVYGATRAGVVDHVKVVVA